MVNGEAGRMCSGNEWKYRRNGMDVASGLSSARRMSQRGLDEQGWRGAERHRVPKASLNN